MSLSREQEKYQEVQLVGQMCDVDYAPLWACAILPEGAIWGKPAGNAPYFLIMICKIQEDLG